MWVWWFQASYLLLSYSHSLRRKDRNPSQLCCLLLPTTFYHPPPRSPLTADRFSLSPSTAKWLALSLCLCYCLSCWVGCSMSCMGSKSTTMMPAKLACPWSFCPSIVPIHCGWLSTGRLRSWSVTYLSARGISPDSIGEDGRFMTVTERISSWVTHCFLSRLGRCTFSFVMRRPSQRSFNVVQTSLGRLKQQVRDSIDLSKVSFPSINSNSLEMLKVFGPNLGTVSGSPSESTITYFSRLRDSNGKDTVKLRLHASTNTSMNESGPRVYVRRLAWSDTGHQNPP